MGRRYATSVFDHAVTGAMIHGVSAPRARKRKVGRWMLPAIMAVGLVATIAFGADAPRLQGAATIAMLVLAAVGPSLLAVRRTREWLGAVGVRVAASRACRRVTSHLAAIMRARRSSIMMIVLRATTEAARARRAVRAALRSRVRVPHIAAHARITARTLGIVVAIP